jgi:hypothetical protein
MSTRWQPARRRPLFRSIKYAKYSRRDESGHRLHKFAASFGQAARPAHSCGAGQLSGYGCAMCQAASCRLSRYRAGGLCKPTACWLISSSCRATFSAIGQSPVISCARHRISLPIAERHWSIIAIRSDVFDIDNRHCHSVVLKARATSCSDFSVVRAFFGPN